MPDNSILKVTFEANNGEALDRLINLIRERGFLVQETKQKPRGPYTSLETTMNSEELDMAVSDADALDVITSRNIIQ